MRIAAPALVVLAVSTWAEWRPVIAMRKFPPLVFVTVTAPLSPGRALMAVCSWAAVKPPGAAVMTGVCVPFVPRRKRRFAGEPISVHMSGPTSITSGR